MARSAEQIRAASARSRIEPFHVMEVIAAAAAREALGHRVLHLEAGQPSTGAPSGAVTAAMSLLADGATLGYTPAMGIDGLRRRIADLYDERYGVPVEPSRVVATAGASGAVVLALLASFDPGARVAVAEPGYPCYRQVMTALDLEPVPLRIGPDDGFLLRADALAAAGPLDGVVVASPANPTGAVYDRSTLDELLDFGAAHGVRVIADEIYHGITFAGTAPTALSDDTIVIGSFSKYFSMTGWRLGWMIVPDDLVEAVDRLSQNIYLCPPALAQHAALAAFDCTHELDAHVRRYAENRDVLLADLTAAGVTDIAPCEGAFYLYGDVSQWGVDSPELSALWLRELGVAATPGVDFDPVHGGRTMRWSLAGSTDDVAEAGRRLVAWAGERRG